MGQYTYLRKTSSFWDSIPIKAFTLNRYTVPLSEEFINCFTDASDRVVM